MSNPLNITTAAFGGLREVTTSPLWQYDYGQILQITGLDLPQAFEVHFSNSRKSGETITQIGTDGAVTIPDMYLTSGADIYCFIFLHDGLTDGETEYVIKIPVRERPEPSDIEPTPVQQDVITEAIAALNDAVEQTGEDKAATAALAEAAAASSLIASEAATQAQGSATAASASATTANNAANTAIDKASEAATSATNAANAKTAAETAQGKAEAAQTAAESAQASAKSAANTATSKASEAAASAASVGEAAQTATAKAAEASASATAASESATSAADSATAASGSATSAATSATTASTKASEASASATAAQTAQTAAEAAQGKAEDAKGEAETTAQSIAASAAQIATNKADITQLKEDLTVVSEKVSAIEEAEGLHKYGVSGIGQSASALTRIWDSVGMTAQVGTDGDNSNVVNNFDDVTPFNRRKCVGHWDLRDGRPHFVVAAYLGDENYVEDGSMGDYVAVECPRAYFYLEGNMLGVSAHHYTGWKPFDIFCHKHNEEDTFEYAYLPAYALALKDGHAVSLPGLDNEQGDYAKLFNAARTYNNDAVKSLAMIEPAAVNFYEWALFTVEFAQQGPTNVMKGCLSLRSDNADTCVFTDATHILTNNYFASRVVGEYICIYSGSASHTNVAYQATHQIVSIVRCDENGTASASGTHQLIEVTDLGKDYVTYDTTGATTYNLAARPYRTGACNDVSTPSGSPVSNTSGYYPMKYRHRENIYGNQYTTFVDLFNKRVGTGDSDYKLEWYYLPDPTKIATPSNSVSLPSDNYVKLDVETPHENYVNGYIKTRKYASDYPNIWIPGVNTGASASTYYAVNAYLVRSSTVRSVRFGGAWTAGYVSLLATTAPSSSSAHSGAHLCFAQ